MTATGNFNVCTAAMLRALKSGAVVCNIGHFDNEIDTAYMRDAWQWEEIKPQVHKVVRDAANNDHLLLLSEGRLVNLGTRRVILLASWMVPLPIRYWRKSTSLRRNSPICRPTNAARRHHG